MKKFQNITMAALWVVVFSIALTSCNIKSSGLKPSTGKTNEMLVVTNTKADWEGRMGKEIKEFFGQNERRRVSCAFDAIEDHSFRNNLLDNFDISMRFPKSFYVATQTNDFIWLRREAEHFSQSVLIYFYPYDEMTAFNPGEIIRIQDSVTKKYIPGPEEGSYMKVGMFYPPVAKQIEFNDAFAVETRGLWEVEGDFMGGPFISYTTVDERYNRVVTILGYVYNPGYDKKNLLRQVEAILHTFEYPVPKYADPDK